jgi:asparagine synthase (glutamine-hydrolysing)
LFAEEGVFNSSRRLQFSTFFLLAEMSQFAGLINSSRQDRRSDIGKALLGLGHATSEPPSLENFAPLGLHIGANGLASSSVPLWNESRDLCLFWRGEVFQNDSDLGKLATRQPAPAQLGSWIIQEYEKNGLNCFRKFNGWFSGLLVDVRENRAILFNDRFGLSRVYFHESSSGFYFASQARALLALEPALREIDPQSLGEWLSCGCVLQNRTLFKGISLLPAASAWIFRPGSPPERKSYFAPADWAQQTKL